MLSPPCLLGQPVRVATAEGARTIRTAGSGDLLAVLHVYAQRDVGVRVPVSASELEHETWARMMCIDDLTVYLAESHGEPVGTATLLLMPNLTYDCAPTAFVEAVVVTVGHRRKGIASAMMNRIVRDTRSAGCNKVQLLSDKRHAADGAHRLYASVGFTPEAEGFRLYHRDVPAETQTATSR